MKDDVVAGTALEMLGTTTSGCTASEVVVKDVQGTKESLRLQEESRISHKPQPCAGPPVARNC